MRDNGYTDYITPAELDSAYLDHCKQSGFAPIDARALREAVRSLEGMYYGRQRIAGPRWQRVRQRVHTERPVLYRFMYYVEFDVGHARPAGPMMPFNVRPCPAMDSQRPSLADRNGQAPPELLAA
jgi:hypothetical protein